jgi:hypothetical protein
MAYAGFRATAAGILLSWFLAACAGGGQDVDFAQEGDIQEFSFVGGEIKEGRVFVNPEFEAQKDPESDIVFLRGQGQTTTIACSCFLEGPGVCVPIIVDGAGGSGPIVVTCGNTDCEGQEIDFCLMEIAQPGQFALKLASPK